MKTRVIQNEPDQPAIEASTAPREPKQIWEVPDGQHIAGSQRTPTSTSGG